MFALISAFDMLPMFACMLQMLAEVQQGGVIFRIKQVSYQNRNQKFLRGRSKYWNSDSWLPESLQSWLPRNVKTLYRDRLNAKFMLYVRSRRFSSQNQQKYAGVGPTLQNEEWRLKTKNRSKNVSESASKIKVDALHSLFQVLTCACWYQEYMLRKNNSL